MISGILYRLVPHLPNFSPVGAIALFSGFYFSKKVSWLLPVSIMIMSDVVLGFHSTSLYVYVGFIFASILGIFLKNSHKPVDILLGSVVSSLLFYLLTNFGVWQATSMYPKSIAGLYESYLMAIPFLRNTLASDIFYNSLFFGAYYLIKNKSLATKNLPI